MWVNVVTFHMNVNVIKGMKADPVFSPNPKPFT